MWIQETQNMETQENRKGWKAQGDRLIVELERLYNIMETPHAVT